MKASPILKAPLLLLAVFAASEVLASPVAPTSMSRAAIAHATPADALAWAEQKLTADDGEPIDAFGFAIAIDGTTALVSAVNAPAAGADGFQGAVYVFTYANGQWTQTQKLTASDAAPGDAFGTSIAIDGTTAIIGAPLKQIGSNAQQGEAYVFNFSGGSWTETQKLTASDGALIDTFGDAVALDGSTAIIGASGVRGPLGESYVGAAYVFSESGGSWTEGQKLMSADRAWNDLFGVSVAVEGGVALIGASQSHWSNGPGPGAIYVFTQSGETWTETQTIRADDGVAGDYFGAALRVDGGSMVIGAPGVTVNAGAYAGAAYVFGESAGTWMQQQKLTADNAAENNYFGRSVAIKGSSVLIGAVAATVNDVPFAGAAYLFNGTGSNWIQNAELTASEPATGDYFGWSVDLLADGTSALAGATHQIDDGSGAPGAAYAYSVDTVFADGFDGGSR